MKQQTIRAQCQQVFIVDGVRKIAERTATIIVSEKQTWAEIYTYYGKAIRRRLGTKAFFTRKDAEVRKLGELRKMAARPDMPDFCGGRSITAARQQLADYAKTGMLH